MALTRDEQLDKALAHHKKTLEIREYDNETSRQVDALKATEGFDDAMTEMRRIETATNNLIASRKVQRDVLVVELDGLATDLVDADK